MSTSAGLRVACVGHVEWVEFARVEHVPLAGEVVHAQATLQEPAGGGAVAAVALARLAGESLLFTALGDDELGHRSVARLEQLGVRVRVAWRSQATRRAVTLTDAQGERTIVTLGERPEPDGADDLPWGELGGADGVYVTAADAGALRAARAARVLVASPRARSALHAGVPLDALVLSGEDQIEIGEAEELDMAPGLLVVTDGGHGGRYRRGGGGGGTWQAVPLPGPRADSYGCGDSFAAGVTYGLAAGLDVDGALHLAARCGAMCLTGHGPYERQLTHAEL